MPGAEVHADCVAAYEHASVLLAQLGHHVEDYATSFDPELIPLFENVWGAVLAAALRLINRGARIPLCGMISEYNATNPPPGPNLRPILANRATVRGFIVSDHADRMGAFLQECAPLVRDGRLRYREDIVDGLEAAPRALIGLFEGRNFGKLIVRVSPEPGHRP